MTGPCSHGWLVAEGSSSLLTCGSLLFPGQPPDRNSLLCFCGCIKEREMLLHGWCAVDGTFRNLPPGRLGIAAGGGGRWQVHRLHLKIDFSRSQHPG